MITEQNLIYAFESISQIITLEVGTPCNLFDGNESANVKKTQYKNNKKKRKETNKKKQEKKTKVIKSTETIFNR
jgi:hypothetical protein